jgi:hypothetical protein
MREGLAHRATVEDRRTVQPSETSGRDLIVRARLTAPQRCWPPQTRILEALVARKLVHGARASRPVATSPPLLRKTAPVAQAALQRASRIAKERASVRAARRATATRFSDDEGVVQEDVGRASFAPSVVLHHDAALGQQARQAKQDRDEPHRRHG